VSIGRQKDCDIVLDDNHVSRVHASLTVSGSALQLSNKSTNGSFVNGKKVDACVLQVNDVVKLDSFEFQVLLLEVEKPVENDHGGISKDELESALLESPAQQEGSARTTVLPEAWADAREKVKLAASPSAANNNAEANGSEPEQVLIHDDVTDMNKMLGTSITPKAKLTPQKRSKPVETVNLGSSESLKGDVTYLFGFHEKIFDETFALSKETLMIGKSSDADIVLDDASVSSKHAKIFSKNKSWFIEDLKSTNGSFINGVQIKEAVQLKKGDFIQLGLLQLVFGQHEPLSYSPKTGLAKWLVVAGSAVAIVSMAAFYLMR
jgi:pSer/pThr/pTyr-binding forkhead associated (FHA) protein